MEIDKIVCLVCDEDCVSKDYVKVGKKELKTLVQQLRKELTTRGKYLKKWLKTIFTIHIKCRKNYSRKNSVKSYNKSIEEKPSTPA